MSEMIGATMRVGMIVTGSVIIVLGILMMLMLWPLTGFETKDSFNISDVNEGERTTYIGEITAITEFGDWYVLELDEGVVDFYTKEKHFTLNDNVVVVIEFGGNVSNWDENEYISIEKIPTVGGILGLSLLVIGLIITIVGLALKKRVLEDFLHFETQPSLKPQQTEQPPPSETQQYDTLKDAAHTKTSTVKTPQIEQITCPKCSNIFKVEVPTRPVKISCPHCGQRGILD